MAQRRTTQHTAAGSASVEMMLSTDMPAAIAAPPSNGLAIEPIRPMPSPQPTPRARSASG